MIATSIPTWVFSCHRSMLRLSKGPKLVRATNVASSSSSLGFSKKYWSRLTLFQGSKSTCASSLTMAALVSRVARFGKVSLRGNLVPSMMCAEDEGR